MANSTKPLPGIEHVVVLMLENRSFDNVLGGLGSYYPSSTKFDGVPPNFSNPDKKNLPVMAWQEVSGKTPYTTDPDPGESHKDMNGQLYGYHKDIIGWRPNWPTKVTPGEPPNMQGFCINYQENLLDHIVDPGPLNPENVMHYFNPVSLPISSSLALSFGVSDAWFASAPNQTYPNRMFAHCATPGFREVLWKNHAYEEDLEYFRFPQDNVNKAYGVLKDLSIFEAIDQQYSDAEPGNNWKIYYHDSPLSAIVDYVNDKWGAENTPCDSTSSQVVHYDNSDCKGCNGCKSGTPKPTTFMDDVANDSLPKYAFIEPRYYSNWSCNHLSPNSNHPGKALMKILGFQIPNGDIDSKGPDEKENINVLNGEALLLDVYARLAENPKVFDKTLLIVTYDEHGGMFDHVPPPSAVSPFEHSDKITNFNYDRYGVRVPTLFINPNIPAKTVFRAPVSAPGGAPLPPLDHTSIIKTLFLQFGENGKLGSQGYLTPRDKAAPGLSGLISPNLNRTDLPSPTELDDKLQNLS